MQRLISIALVLLCLRAGGGADLTPHMSSDVFRVGDGPQPGIGGAPLRPWHDNNVFKVGDDDQAGPGPAAGVDDFGKFGFDDGPGKGRNQGRYHRQGPSRTLDSDSPSPFQRVQ